MKLKQHFTTLKSQAELNNEDFNKFIEALPDDMEIPDIAVNLLAENFLTRKRAQSDSQVYDKIRAETLNAVDVQIKEILPMLSIADREAIDKEKSSFEKLKLVKAGFDNAIKASKNNNPDDSETVKELKKTQAELTERIKSINLDHENSVKGLKDDFEKDKKGMKLDWTLDKKLADFEFGDEYKSIRPAIIQNVISQIKSENVLELDEKGNIQVLEKDTGKPKFNGNDPVSIDSLLAKPIEPFVKKNNASGGDGRQQQQQRSNGQQQQQQQSPQKSVQEMTLHERRQAGIRM